MIKLHTLCAASVLVAIAATPCMANAQPPVQKPPSGITDLPGAPKPAPKPVAAKPVPVVPVAAKGGPGPAPKPVVGQRQPGTVSNAPPPSPMTPLKRP